MSYRISYRGCVGFFGDIMVFIDGWRYVGRVHFEEGLDQFSPRMESSLRSLMVITNGGDIYYVRFNPFRRFVSRIEKSLSKGVEKFSLCKKITYQIF